MGCNCSESAPCDPDLQQGPEAVQLRVLVCTACSKVREDGACSISGRDPRRSRVCPLDKWTACETGHSCYGGGLTRWPTFGGRLPDRLRITWCGSPMPLRVWWALRTGHRLEKQPGCGCIRRLKVVWLGVLDRVPIAAKFKGPDWVGAALRLRRVIRRGGHRVDIPRA